MRAHRNVIQLFILMAITLVLLAACATTPIGKAIQGADLQQKVIHEAAVQVAMIHLQGGIAEPVYADIKKAYADWAGVQVALAQSVAAWKAVGTAENDAKVTAVLARVGPLAEAYLKLVGRWVNLTDIQKKVSKYCLLHGVSTTSGVRSTKHNRDVGGVPFSPHRFGVGMDVVYDDLNTKNDPARLEVAKRLGLKILQEGDHDHIQPDSWPAG